MQNKNRVTLFIQCIVDGVYPEVGMAVVDVFRRLGIPMDCPTEQTCCGQPAFNAGYRKQARKAARRFIEIFQSAETIVCPSGSCVTMVRHHYPDLFDDEPEWRRRAEEIAGRTFEFSEYLVDVLGAVQLGAVFKGRVTYHDSCHLRRALGVWEQPRQLIRNISGVEFVEMTDPDRCCGFGGTFSVKYPEISTALVDDKVRNIVHTGADVVAGCDMGCLMNIQGRLSRLAIPTRTLHLAQLLAMQ